MLSSSHFPPPPREKRADHFLLILQRPALPSSRATPCPQRTTCIQQLASYDGTTPLGSTPSRLSSFYLAPARSNQFPRYLLHPLSRSLPLVLFRLLSHAFDPAFTRPFRARFPHLLPHSLLPPFSPHRSVPFP